MCDINITPADLYAMTKNRRLYWRRKMAGLCTRCGKAPPWGGRILCAECQRKEAKWIASTDPDGEERRAKVRARAARLRSQGLCVDCTRPVVPGRTRCENCLKSKREYMRRKTEKQREKHGCGKYPGRIKDA